MNNKWNPEQVRRAQRWLANTWPDLFTSGADLKPLSLKIHKQILQHADRPQDISRRALTEALKRHTGSFGYLFGMVKGTHRHNLLAEPEELIAPAHKQWAKATLRMQQKIAQSAGRKKSSARRNFAPIARKRPLIASRKPVAAPTVSYKKPRRKLIIKPATLPLTPETASAA